MSHAERADRGRRAGDAFVEFVQPALVDARATYLEAMTRIAADEPWQAGKITKLAIAQRVIDLVEEHLRAAMANGIEAQKTIDHANKVSDIPERRRTILQSLGAKL